MLEDLKNNLTKVDPSKWRSALLGSDSLLSQSLRALRVDVASDSQQKPASVGELAGLIDEVFCVSSESAGSGRQSLVVTNLAIITASARDKAIHALTALYGVLRITERIRSDAAGDLDELLQKTFAAVSGAYGYVEPRAIRILESAPARQGDPVADLLSGHVETQHPAAYWMVFDLLDRLVTRYGLPPPRIRSASTSIVGATQGNREAFLMTLTVELLPCSNGPAYPDLFHLGLTCVDGIKKHFEEAWKATGLSRWFRCRWRIEVNGPEMQTPAPDSEDIRPNSHSGNSAQAAALVAMLAACGDPYRTMNIDGIEDFPDPESLAADVAISAGVNCLPGTSVKALQLSSVGAIPAKLSKTRAILDFVVLWRDQERSAELNSMREERQKYDQDSKSQGKSKGPPVGVEYADTIENALDLMLESNQYQTQYRKIIRDAWLKQWERGTARFPGDSVLKEGDPDWPNVPREKEVAASPAGEP